MSCFLLTLATGADMVLLSGWGGDGERREGKGPGSRFLSRHTRGRSRALALSGRPLPAHFRSLSVPPPGSRALPSRPDDEGEAGAACRPGPGSDLLTEARGWRRRAGRRLGSLPQAPRSSSMLHLPERTLPPPPPHGEGKTMIAIVF